MRGYGKVAWRKHGMDYVMGHAGKELSRLSNFIELFSGMNWGSEDVKLFGSTGPRVVIQSS